MSVLLTAIVAVEPAEGHHVAANYGATGATVEWTMDASTLAHFNNDLGIFTRAAAAWEVHDLGNRIKYRNFQSGHSNRNMVRLEYPTLELDPDELADATTPCSASNSGCEIRINRRIPFCGDGGSNCFNLESVMTHEFGHHVGLLHASSDPLAASDSRKPLMRYDLGQGEVRRGLRPDDISGFQLARYQQPYGFLANSSFDYGTPTYTAPPYSPSVFGWGFGASANGGSASRYCTGGHTGSCFVEFNGNGAVGSSLYQDLWNWSWLYNDIDGEVYARNPTSLATSVSLTIWNLGTGTVVQNTVCPLPANSGWIRCAVPRTGLPARLRFQIYNNGTTNVRVDSARLTGP